MSKGKHIFDYSKSPYSFTNLAVAEINDDEAEYYESRGLLPYDSATVCLRTSRTITIATDEWIESFGPNTRSKYWIDVMPQKEDFKSFSFDNLEDALFAFTYIFSRSKEELRDHNPKISTKIDECNFDFRNNC